MHDEQLPEADLRLVESEQRYQAVIENASDMIQSVRPDGTFEFVNSAWRKALGYTDVDLEQMTVWDIVHPDAIEHCQVEFYRAIQGHPIDFIATTFVGKEGQGVPVEGSVTSRFVGDEIVATHGFFRDVTERLRARELEERAARLEREERARYLEKMAALGKLSAGLAHELNNPAAAIQRASANLPEAMERRDDALRSLVREQITAEGWTAIDRVLDRPSPAGDGARDPVAVSALEEVLEQWLDDHGVEGAWNVAPGLVEAGVTEQHLESIAAAVPAPALKPALAWITESVSERESAEIINQSSRRIADLVKAIKGYTHMDRATEHAGDVHDGIENTLVILGHRLRNVQVERDYDRALPPLQMFGNTLNQVWTNLLDNAIDAMDGSGRIAIRTRQQGDQVVVEIEDNGKGIPPEDLACIFEPFFTSKPQGVGTGLGLDTVWRIITEEHGGTVVTESVPGQTVFRVFLPVPE
jgi:PAS domain S-box-containing protein